MASRFYRIAPNVQRQRLGQKTQHRFDVGRRLGIQRCRRLWQRNSNTPLESIGPKRHALFKLSRQCILFTHKVDALDRCGQPPQWGWQHARDHSSVACGPRRLPERSQQPRGHSGLVASRQRLPNLCGG